MYKRQQFILNGITQHAKIAAVKIGSADRVTEQGIPAEQMSVHIDAHATLGMTRRIKKMCIRDRFSSFLFDRIF